MAIATKEIVKTYTPQNFEPLIGAAGFSDKLLQNHFKLYQGYVANTNKLADILDRLQKEAKTDVPEYAELKRRFGWEYNGMRLHELYFSQFEGGSTPLTTGGTLETAIKTQYGETDYLLQEVRSVAMMRGPGWSILYFDPEAKQFLVGFTGEQHQGHFANLPIILALDVWEHAFLLDYGAQGKAKYVDAFFKNLNWGVAEKRFSNIS